jgi:hypothetical protein
VGKPGGKNSLLVKRILKESAKTQLETPPTHFSAGAEKEHETRQTGPSVSGPRIKSRFNVWTTSGHSSLNPVALRLRSCMRNVEQGVRKKLPGDSVGQYGYVTSTLMATVPLEKTRAKCLTSPSSEAHSRTRNFCEVYSDYVVVRSEICAFNLYICC